MLTVLLYVLVIVVVGAALFFVASVVFGRGEALAPIPPGTTATVLPASDVTGTDVRDLRFQQTLRGYKMGEVDWALDRLAREIDELKARIAEYEVSAETLGDDVPLPDDRVVEKPDDEHDESRPCGSTRPAESVAEMEQQDADEGATS
ncbi:DivIVA domain-containing protein [Rhodococcus sp. HNM0563]|uniref:DivIVA domain-containing protein n=1 Tax=Rhodococcus sp. HNM0563 TaxID=2716339 RepID=UPI00146B2588|nr:DivIVA domain-containing protein [Rhodococcus sp. HNM0563]NLU62176.1 DivIVA domain-containing protein [Rhodococcus sp. HNM0563]